MTTDSRGTARKQTVQDLVLERYPTATEEDDGERIYIRVAEKESRKCGECGHPYLRDKALSACRAIGSAGNSKAAWEDAARDLMLL